MDNEPNHLTKQTRRAQRWRFTFIGGTTEKPKEEVNRDELARLVSQNQVISQELFPLSTTQIGDRVVLTQIFSGKNMEHQLNKMGLTLGSEVHVVSKTIRGSVIISIEDEQIGLGAGMAERVMVTLVAED